MVQIDISIRKVAPPGDAIRSPRARPGNMATVCQPVPFAKPSPPPKKSARELRMRSLSNCADTRPCALTFPCRATTYSETVKWRSRLNCTRAFLADNPHFDRVQANARLHTPQFRPVIGTAVSVLQHGSKSESTLSLDKNHWTYAMTQCAMEHQSNARLSRLSLAPNDLADGVRPRSCPAVNRMPKIRQLHRLTGHAAPVIQTSREAPRWSSLQKADHVISGLLPFRQLPITPVGSIESSAVFGGDTPRSKVASPVDHDDPDRCVYTTPTNEMLDYYTSANGSERDSDVATPRSETHQHERYVNMLELPEVCSGVGVIYRKEAVMPPFVSRQLVFRKSGCHFTRIRAEVAEKHLMSPFRENQFLRIQRPALLTTRILTGRR